MWCPRIWGKEQVRGGGEGVSRRDRNVKQSEWLIAGGVGNPGGRPGPPSGGTTQQSPYSAPAMLKAQTTVPGALAHGRPPRFAPRGRDQEQKR